VDGAVLLRRGVGASRDGGGRRHDAVEPAAHRRQAFARLTTLLLCVKTHSVDDSQYGPRNQSDNSGSDSPGRAYGRRHQLMTASTVLMKAGMVHATTLTPGSGVPNPHRRPRARGARDAHRDGDDVWGLRARRPSAHRGGAVQGLNAVASYSLRSPGFFTPAPEV
jgi:hypothetical protein